MNDPLHTQINFNISNSFICTPKYAVPFSLDGVNFTESTQGESNYLNNIYTFII